MRGLVVFRFDPRDEKVNPVTALIQTVFIPLVWADGFSDAVLRARTVIVGKRYVIVGELLAALEVTDVNRPLRAALAPRCV